MNSQETVIQLRELKLKGMADAFESILSLPVQNRPTMEATIARLAEAEAQDRRNRKTEMYLKTSRLRYTALIEDIICGTDRNFTKDDLAALADCSFIRRHENLLIQGKCGCGKSFSCLCFGASGMYARIQDSLPQHEQLRGEGGAQQTRWYLPENDHFT